MTWDAFNRGGAGAAQGDEELRMLWRRYKDHHDPAARDRLILTFAPLVKYVAGRMNSHLPAHVEETDLIYSTEKQRLRSRWAIATSIE